METPPAAGPARVPFLLNHAIALLLYLGSAGIGLEMAEWRANAPLIWPPAGLGLALLLLGGGTHVAVVVAGAALVRWFEGGGLPDALVYGIGYGLAAWVAWVALGRAFGFQNGLERLLDVSAFLVIGVALSPLVSALLTTTALWQFQPDPGTRFGELLGLRWLGDALGVLVVAPFLLVWHTRTRINWRNAQTAEVLIWLAVLILIGALVFRNWAPSDTLQYPMELAMFPIMAWASIRFGQRGVTTSILLLGIMAVGELRDAMGPEAVVTLSQPPGYLWAFVGILSTTGLYLAATWTELRCREDEVRVNEERLRAFVQALPDLALVFRKDGVCSEVFAPVQSRFRQHFSALRGEPLESIFPADLARTFRETLGEVMRKRNLTVVRYAVCINGEDRFFEGRFAPIEGPDGQATAAMLVSYDLTESQLARRSLQRRDQLLKTLTEVEGVLLKEKVFHRGVRRALECVGKGIPLDMVQVYQAQASADGGGEPVRTHEWLRESPFTVGRPVITAAGLDALRPGWRDALAAGGSWEIHYGDGGEAQRAFLGQLGMRHLALHGLRRHEDGAWGFVAFGSSLERSEDKEHARTVYQAITESLRAYLETQLIQEQLRAAKEAAVAADHAKSEFLAIMSHEIRTPMNAIIGFSDLLRQTPLTEQQGEYLDIIGRSGRDLLELINNILDFSRLESRGIQLERTRFNLETALMEVMEMVLFRAKEKGLALEFRGNADIRAPFWGDPLRLRQILLNLLTNALKFTREGSVTLEVATLEVEEPWYTFDFRVIDTGIGIPEEHREELFKPFRQGDSSTTREYGGAGLGLTIVQRLVDKMGGRVELESTVGKGSVFRVVLRLERDTGGEPPPAPRAGEDQLHKSFAERHPLSILVVEDDPMNTRLICEVLERLGYHPEAVSDGFKALAALAEARHNLVIMDMQMARLDGLETTRRIRMGECGERVRSVPIVALTAIALDDERQRILESGVDYYVSKPLRLAELKRILEEVSSRAGGA